MSVLGMLAVLAGGLGAQEDSRLRELVEGLLDDRIEVRERAAAELVEQGSAALPELDRLRNSPDLEVRSRAAAVRRSIAENEVIGRFWRRGSRVTLLAESAPLGTVLGELSRQSKETLRFDPARLGDRISIRVENATFWDALEAVCRAAPALTWKIEGDVLSVEAEHRPPYPSLRQDEFTVWLEGITYSRDYDFSGAPRSTYALSLACAWQTGVAPLAVDPKITEILDERGASVLTPDRLSSFGARLEKPRGRLKRDSVLVPVPPGAALPRSFSRIRGVATFSFPRTYRDVRFDLQAAAPPAPVALGGGWVSVKNLRPGLSALTFEVEVRIPQGSGEPPVDRLPADQIALVDDQGTLHRGRSTGRAQGLSGAFQFQQETLEVALPADRIPVAIQMRLVESTLDKRLPFEFRDLPLE